MTSCYEYAMIARTYYVHVEAYLDIFHFLLLTLQQQIRKSHKYLVLNQRRFKCLWHEWLPISKGLVLAFYICISSSYSWPRNSLIPGQVSRNISIIYLHTRKHSNIHTLYVSCSNFASVRCVALPYCTVCQLVTDLECCTCIWVNLYTAVCNNFY